MILGILAIIMPFLGLLTLTGVVLAVTFGALGMRQHVNHGQAVAGLVLGVVAGIFYLIFGVATLGVGFVILWLRKSASKNYSREAANPVIWDHVKVKISAGTAEASSLLVPMTWKGSATRIGLHTPVTRFGMLDMVNRNEPSTAEHQQPTQNPGRPRWFNDPPPNYCRWSVWSESRPSCRPR
jgi:hypothetical protein